MLTLNHRAVPTQEKSEVTVLSKKVRVTKDLKNSARGCYTPGIWFES